MTGMAHRKAATGAWAAVAPNAGGRMSAARAPSARTTIPSRLNVTLTDPSRSVRWTSAPIARSRSSVGFVGCPYGLPTPAEMIATRGRATSRKAWVVAVRLP